MIPAYNEAENLLTLVETIKQYRANNNLFELDYIIINDGSADSTEEVCKLNNLHAINLINNLGIGGAVGTGYLYAHHYNYDIAVQFDGDGQHDINSLQSLLEPILENTADFTIGSRFIANISGFKSTSFRRFGINLLSNMIFLLTGQRIYDVTSGFRAANKKTIKMLAKHYPIKYPEPESIMYMLQHNIKIKEVAVNMFARQTGTSSISVCNAAFYMLETSYAILINKFIKHLNIS